MAIAASKSLKQAWEMGMRREEGLPPPLPILHPFNQSSPRCLMLGGSGLAFLQEGEEEPRVMPIGRLPSPALRSILDGVSFSSLPIVPGWLGKKRSRVVALVALHWVPG